MKVLDARVDWNIGYANSPSLQVLVDKIPDSGELKYLKYGELYISTKDGYISVFNSSDRTTLRFDKESGHYRTVTNHPVYDINKFKGSEGFGGRRFHIRMCDGEERILCGPWHGNSAHQNKLVPWPLQHMECDFIESKLGWDNGFTFTGGFISLGTAHSAVKEFIDSDVSILPDPWWKANNKEFLTPQRIDLEGKIIPKTRWCKRRIEDCSKETIEFILRTGELHGLRGTCNIPEDFPNRARLRLK